MQKTVKVCQLLKAKLIQKEEKNRSVETRWRARKITLGFDYPCLFNEKVFPFYSRRKQMVFRGKNYLDWIRGRESLQKIRECQF